MPLTTRTLEAASQGEVENRTRTKINVRNHHHTTTMKPEMKAVESSQIEKIGYRPESKELFIQFHPNRKQKEAGQPGSVYQYQNVTEADHKALIEAESIGSAFGKHIKPNATKFPFKKVE